MKIHLLCLFIAAALPASAAPVPFPSTAGNYDQKGWHYTYKIEGPGTRSERRIGKLFFEGKEVKGKPGEVNRGPLGPLVYFGEGGYDQGWLNTRTYDRMVFKADGTLTDEVRQLFLPAGGKN
jgi:hypothetical protein